MSRFCQHALVVLLLLLGPLVPGRAHAATSYDNCSGFITSVPAVINAPGTWCLKQSVNTAITSGAAITIAADNVTLDCNDFKLDGQAAGTSTLASGVSASNRLNAKVRHCIVRGFYIGVFLTGSGHLVEDNRLDKNRFTGLEVHGDGSVLRRNQVYATGGSPLNAKAYGIVTLGSVDILDNKVTTVRATTGLGGDALGISTDGNSDGSIVDNRIIFIFEDAPAGHGYGISNANSDRISVRSNVVEAGAQHGIELSCANANGRASNNLLDIAAQSIVGCTDAGGNYSLPP